MNHHIENQANVFNPVPAPGFIWMADHRDPGWVYLRVFAQQKHWAVFLFTVTEVTHIPSEALRLHCEDFSLNQGTPQRTQPPPGDFRTYSERQKHDVSIKLRSFTHQEQFLPFLLVLHYRIINTLNVKTKILIAPLMYHGY